MQSMRRNMDGERYKTIDITIARKVKDFKNLNCKVDKEVSDLLEKFIADTGLSKTATVEKALKMYIEHYKKTGKI